MEYCTVGVLEKSPVDTLARHGRWQSSQAHQRVQAVGRQEASRATNVHLLHCEATRRS
jgi:hypothetical protein